MRAFIGSFAVVFCCLVSSQALAETIGPELCFSHKVSVDDLSEDRNVTSINVTLRDAPQGWGNYDVSGGYSFDLEITFLRGNPFETYGFCEYDGKLRVSLNPGHRFQ